MPTDEAIPDALLDIALFNPSIAPAGMNETLLETRLDFFLLFLASAVIKPYGLANTTDSQL